MKTPYRLSRRTFLTATLGAAIAANLGSAARAGLELAFDDATRRILDEALDEGFAKVRSPGVAATVVMGHQVWTAERGATTMTGKGRPQRNVHTRIGSVTKTMVGTLTLQAVDEGLLHLDDTIDTWFPNFPRGGDITVGMLGTMASGIGSYTLDDNWVDQYFADPGKSWKPEELITFAASVPRPFEPGQGFQYCNTNFVMLGVIAEKLRGKPLGQVLEQQLWAPLRMSHSSYPLGTDLPEPYWHGYTLQSVKGDTPIDATHWSPTFGAGAGQVVSDLHDLRIWARALGTGALLKPETQAFREKPNPHSTRGGRSYCFALGSNNGWLEHSGELPGYNTQVAYLPKRDLSIVVMANSDLNSTEGLHPAIGVYHTLASAIAPDDPLE